MWWPYCTLLAFHPNLQGDGDVCVDALLMKQEGVLKFLAAAATVANQPLENYILRRKSVALLIAHLGRTWGTLPLPAQDIVIKNRTGVGVTSSRDPDSGVC